MTRRTGRQYRIHPRCSDFRRPAGFARECHPGLVLEALTGTGLAASAGLNAYIPLVTMGLLARYTAPIDLPTGWSWLSNGWTPLTLAWLLAGEAGARAAPGGGPCSDPARAAGGRGGRRQGPGGGPRERRGPDRGPADRGRP